MLERLAFIVWMGLTTTSIGFVGLSLYEPWPHPGLSMFLAAGGGCVLAWMLGTYGRARLHFAECEKALNEAATPAIEDDPTADRLRRLLDSWEELDARRDLGGIDPWRVQELRREAASILQSDPRLRTEFARELSRHPELGDRRIHPHPARAARTFAAALDSGPTLPTVRGA